MEYLENWVLKGYNGIQVALNSELELATRVRSELEGRLYKDTAKFIRQIRYIQVSLFTYKNIRNEIIIYF